MKNKLLYIILACFLYVGCDMGDFGSINNDPNQPTQYDTRFLFASSAAHVGDFFRNDWACRDQMYPHYMSEWRTVQQGKMQVLDYSLQVVYNRVIKNLDQIIELNMNETTKGLDKVTQLGSTANQIAMCKVLRAYFYLHYTDVLGDIPYTEANEGKNNYFPKYDTQESIYKDLYKQLKEAVAGFDGGDINSDYDMFYAGDVAQWKKLGNSIRLIMAMRLSKVEPATGKAWFEETLGNGFGYISSNADNFVHKFKNEYDADVSENNNSNPIWENVVLDGRDDYKPTTDIVDYMNANTDPRLPAYFQKAELSDTYVGVPFAISEDDISNYPAGTLSAFAAKFLAQNAVIPMITAAQIKFTVAEAIERYGVAGDAAATYKSAIELSMMQHDVYDATAFNTYYNQAGIEYGTFAGDIDSKYKQIAQQKWLSTYMQDGIEAWTEFRRLGWPDLKTGPAATIEELPRRFTYHADDYGSNREQYDAAVARQGADVITTRVWWDVE